MPPVRSISEIAKKWAEVTPQRAPQYEAGVKAPKQSWENNRNALPLPCLEAVGILLCPLLCVFSQP